MSINELRDYIKICMYRAENKYGAGIVAAKVVSKKGVSYLPEEIWNDRSIPLSFKKGMKYYFKKINK